MNYLLAILLPPLSILLTGHPFLGILVFAIWVPALFLSMFLGFGVHMVFVLLAWVVIHDARSARRERRMRD